ncbi:transcriptional and immune response regulator a [Latimeria chalumnae]|uniref:transcriptional and immune response regulator a n=1 Tax=Latimeria chalumnae TaxID=7897 RepID=UPI0003C10C4F|nr:PREDICTED: protein C8orf4 homolog [Latimeria chalumnae]|eukprot:XP_005991929.1 PREDICTED: protein C8orf4 homolog [Latimeria chalumnae]
MRARRHFSQQTMSNLRRVSPAVSGHGFHTAARKKAVGNIFESIDQESLQRLFQKSGDKRAEERARIVCSQSQDTEEKVKALIVLRQRTKDKIFQLLRLRRFSLKMH